MALTLFILKALLTLIDTVYLMRGMWTLGRQICNVLASQLEKMTPISFINRHNLLHLHHRKENFG